MFFKPQNGQIQPIVTNKYNSEQAECHYSALVQNNSVKINSVFEIDWINPYI